MDVSSPHHLLSCSDVIYDHLVEVEQPPDRRVVRSDDAPLRLGLLLARLGPHPGVRGLGLGEAHLPLGPRAPVCTGDTVRSENSIMWNMEYIVSLSQLTWVWRDT